MRSAKIGDIIYVTRESGQIKTPAQSGEKEYIMKKFVKLIAVLAMAVMTFSLVSCSVYGKIEKAFVKDGYEVVSAEDSLIASVTDAVLNSIKSEAEEDDVTITIHYLKKGLLDYAAVIEFTGSKEMEEFIMDNEDIMNFIGDLQESDYVNGNCVLAFGSNNAKEVFKNA